MMPAMVQGHERLLRGTDFGRANYGAGRVEPLVANLGLGLESTLSGPVTSVWFQESGP